MRKKILSEIDVSVWNIQIEYSHRSSVMIAVFGSAVFVLWGYIFAMVAPNTFDPVWFRALVVLPFFGLLITPKKFLPHYFSTQGILLCATFFVCSHSILLWLTNPTSLHYAFGVILSFSVTLLFATSLKYFVVVSSFAFLTCLAPVVLGASATNAWFFFFGIATTVGSAFFALSTRLRSQQILLMQKAQLERQFESLMNSHKQLVAEKVRNASSARLAAIGEMAAGVAHEVNNPLTIVRGYLTRLKTINTNEPIPVGAMQEHVFHIYKSLDRIAHVVRSLVNISASDTNRARESVSLKNVVEISTGFFKERVKQHSIQLSVEIPETDYFTSGFPNQLSQCLVNLLSNAFDAAKESAQAHPDVPNAGWIKVTMTAEENFVQISVMDSGAGIDPTRISKVFDPFYTTKLSKKASGLGLSVSKAMIEDLGGSLDYDENCPNTRFVLRIPAHIDTRKTSVPSEAKKLAS